MKATKNFVSSAAALVTLSCAVAAHTVVHDSAQMLLMSGPGDSGGTRLLIIEAEDLGMAHSVDKATFEALDKGWVTSAGILTPAPWFPEVAFWANQHRQADLGVQLDLTSDWKSYLLAGSVSAGWGIESSGQHRVLSAKRSVRRPARQAGRGGTRGTGADRPGAQDRGSGHAPRPSHARDDDDT